MANDFLTPGLSLGLRKFQWRWALALIRELNRLSLLYNSYLQKKGCPIWDSLYRIKRKASSIVRNRNP